MRDKVLIVDDAEINRIVLAEILKEEYRIAEAENGIRAIDFLEENHEDVAMVLLDLVMPKMDVFAVLETMREREWMEKIPVLVISGETSVTIEQRCFEYGVSDFIRKPFDNTLVRKRVNNIASLFQYQNELEEKVEEQTRTLKKQNDLLKVQAAKLKKSNEDIIDILGTVVEYRNLESGEHIKRVKCFTAALANEMMVRHPEYGLTEAKIEVIVTSSSLHDVGKIAIPDTILLKPAKLTAEEFDCMKTHTVKGGEILDNFKGVWEEEYQKTSYEICRHHHERYDGRGYPDGLAGDEIPISAQIVSIADVYDALVSERVYKKAMSKEEAFSTIMEGKCGVFSPKLLQCFQNVRGEFEALADRNS